MIKINIKDADRFIEVIESTPKPIIIIDHIKTAFVATIRAELY